MQRSEAADAEWHSAELVMTDVESTYCRSHSTKGHGLKAVERKIQHSQTGRPFWDIRDIRQLVV